MASTISTSWAALRLRVPAGASGFSARARLPQETRAFAGRPGLTMARAARCEEVADDSRTDCAKPAARTALVLLRVADDMAPACLGGAWEKDTEVGLAGGGHVIWGRGVAGRRGKAGSEVMRVCGGR